MFRYKPRKKYVESKKNKDEKKNENRFMSRTIQSPGCSGHDRLIRNQLSIQLNQFEYFLH